MKIKAFNLDDFEESLKKLPKNIVRKTIQLKQVQIDNGTNCFAFLYTYVEKKRLDILNATIKRAQLIRDRNKEIRFLINKKLKQPLYKKVDANKLKYYIVDIETEPGYANQHDNKNLYYVEISRKEITMKELEDLFK